MLLVYRMAPTAPLQMQPVEGAFGQQEIKAAVEEVVGKPVMVVHLDPLTLSGALDDMARIGRALGGVGGGKAQEAVKDVRRRMEVVRSMCSGRQRKRVLCLQWLDPVFTAGAWVPELIRMAGGIPVGYETTRERTLRDSGAPLPEPAGGPQPGALSLAAKEVGAGELVKDVRKADVVVLAICGCTLSESMEQLHSLVRGAKGAFSGALPFLQLSAKGGGIKGLPAAPIRDDSQSPSQSQSLQRPVAVVDGSILFSRPGPNLLPSLEVLAEILHPEAQNFGHHSKLWRFA